VKLSNLVKTTTRKTRRVGQGISAGKGKTAGRGTKGQKARTGKKLRPGFEGGQMPLVQRVPKRRGFTVRKAKSQTIKTDLLNSFKDGSKITLESLIKEKIVKKSAPGVKIVLGDKIEKKLEIFLPTTSRAKEAIEKAGGKVIK